MKHINKNILVRYRKTKYKITTSSKKTKYKITTSSKKTNFSYRKPIIKLQDIFVFHDEFLGKM